MSRIWNPKPNTITRSARQQHASCHVPRKPGVRKEGLCSGRWRDNVGLSLGAAGQAARASPWKVGITKPTLGRASLLARLCYYRDRYDYDRKGRDGR